MSVTAVSVSSGSDAAGQQVVVHNVFVYGSLMADDVVRVLLKRVPQHTPAILHDFHRFSIRGRVYPAILPAHKKSVNSTAGWQVLMGITYPELDILDAFEDVEYERRDVEVAMVLHLVFLQSASVSNVESCHLCVERRLRPQPVWSGTWRTSTRKTSLR